MNQEVARVLPLCALLLWATSCSAPMRVIKAARQTVASAERTAQGHPEEILPVLLTVLGESPDYAVVSKDGHSVVAEVLRIPGLGIALPRLEDKAYYLRADLKSLGDTTKVALSFFRSVRGLHSLRDELDSILLPRGVSQLFAHVFVALLKSGVSFI